MTLDNVLGRSREEVDGHWVFRYENGLVVHTDPFLRADGDRILPVGGPQDTMCNYLARAPERVRDKRVLDAFAGSGVLGLMALKLGAARVDFVDVNPRARRFQEANAERNGFDTTRYEAHLESIETFESSPPYDLVLANPPFVPTPPGIDGTLTSAAGAEGNDLVGVLLRRLEGLLLPTGEAFVYLMQLVAQGTPLIAPSIAVHITDRPVDLTPTQEEPFPLDSFCTAYRQCFDDQGAAIDAWRNSLNARHGALEVQQYVMHVGARHDKPTEWRIPEDLRSKYGVSPYPAHVNDELALGRALENVVPRDA